MATRIKRYEAEEEQLAELMLRIESEMGPGAQLEVKPFKRNAIFGMGGQKMVEVIATVELGEFTSSTAADAADLASAETSSELEAELKDSGTVAPPAAASGSALAAPAAAQATTARQVHPTAAAAAQQNKVPVALDEIDSVAVALLASKLYEGSSEVAADAAHFDAAAYYPGAIAAEVAQVVETPAETAGAAALTTIEPTAPAVAPTAMASDAATPSVGVDDYDDFGVRADEVSPAAAAYDEPRAVEPQPEEQVEVYEPALGGGASATQEAGPAPVDPGIEPPEISIKSDYELSPEELLAEDFLVREEHGADPGTSVPVALPEHPEELSPAKDWEDPDMAQAQFIPSAFAGGVASSGVTESSSPSSTVTPAVDEPPASPALTAISHSLASEDPTVERLLDWDIRGRDVAELAAAAGGIGAGSAEDMLAAIEEHIARNANVGGGIQLRHTPPARVVAIVGPTGVGKTSTVCKLAAHFAFEQDRNVGLVSLDNYRIAATEQLRTYGEIAGLELDLAFSPQEYAEVIARRRDGTDLVLVDTAGRSPNSARQVAELAAVFDADPPDEVHLVISAGTRRDDLRQILEAFRPLNYSHIIVSKLDESRNLGILHNLSRLTDQPISYFTIGQTIPEDVEPATLPFIRQWIAKGKVL